MSNSTDLTRRESWIKTHSDFLSLVSQNKCVSQTGGLPGQVAEEQHRML